MSLYSDAGHADDPGAGARGVRRFRRRRHGDRDARRAARAPARRCPTRCASPTRRRASSSASSAPPSSNPDELELTLRRDAGSTRWRKPKTVYSLHASAAARRPKWQGQCPHCGVWNTLVETIAAPAPARFESVAGARSSVHAARVSRGARDVAHSDRPRGIRSRAGRRPRAGRRRSCSAAIPASASRRCCCRRGARSAPRTGRSTSPARNRSSRSRCARSVWGSSTRRSSCSPKCSSRRSSRRSTRRRPRSSSSIRSRPSTPRRSRRRPAASRRCANARRS